MLQRGRSQSDPSSITEVRLGEAHRAGKRRGAVIPLLVGHVSAVSFIAASRSRLGRRDITESGLAIIQSRRLHPWWSHFICVQET